MNPLYQQVILDHNKSPKNYGTLAAPTHRATGHNPLCGDKMALTLVLDDKDVLQDIQFEIEGCALSKASASLMTEHVKGMTRDACFAVFDMFRQLITGRMTPLSDYQEEVASLKKLVVFSTVSSYPARVKCVILPWYTLKEALDGGSSATTEDRYS